MADQHETASGIRPRANARVVFTPKDPTAAPRTGWYDADSARFHETDGRAWRWHEVATWSTIERNGHSVRGAHAAEARWSAY